MGNDDSWGMGRIMNSKHLTIAITLTLLLFIVWLFVTFCQPAEPPPTIPPSTTPSITPVEPSSTPLLTGTSVSPSATNTRQTTPIFQPSETPSLTATTTQPATETLVPTPTPTVTPTLCPVVHTVERGQYLWLIAEIYYDSGRKWVDIYEANRSKIRISPNLIFAGQSFTVPCP